MSVRGLHLLGVLHRLGADPGRHRPGPLLLHRGLPALRLALHAVEDRRRVTHLSGAEGQGSQLQLINMPGSRTGSTHGC